MTLVVDVFTYAQVANPDGIPSDWPAKCIEIDSAQPVTSGATRMTPAQLAAYKAARQASYDAWYAGTYTTAQAARALADQRADARSFLLNDPSPDMRVDRALALLVLDEINALRQLWMTFKTATAAATNLANFQARVAALPDTPDRTKAQLLNAIAAKITDGSAD